MKAKKSDFWEKSDFSNLVLPKKIWKNRISQIWYYPKMSQEIRFLGKIGFLGGPDISALLH
jgi:hypothetical protein